MTATVPTGGHSLFEAARAMGIHFAEEFQAGDKFVKANGLKLHYLDWGNDKLPPMLLLHGGAQTAHSWDFFGLSMRDSYHVVALAQRGHGDSDWSPDRNYSLDAYIADIKAVTESIGFNKFTLVGLSLGGRNSFTFAARYPEKVKELVIVDVGPDVEAQGVRHVLDFTRSVDTFDSFEAMVQHVHSYNVRRPLDQIRGSILHNVKSLPDGRWTWKYDRNRGQQSTHRVEQTARAWELIKNIQCPTLIVRGGESDVLAPATVDKMCASIPNSRSVVVPRAGHLVQGDNPVDFEKAVRAFLGRS